MDQYLFFAIAAVVLASVRYGIYFNTIYQGKTKPHAFTWMLWGVVTTIATFAQFSLGGGPSAWVLAFVSSTCFIVGFYALFYGARDYRKSDWVALVICILAIPVWQITKNPLAAMAIVMFIDLLTYWPTARKSFNAPQTEPPISYGFAGARYFLLLFAVSDPTWQTLMYPFFLMMTDWGFALYILIRRYQLGYPLHEYSTNVVK